MPLYAPLVRAVLSTRTAPAAKKCFARPLCGSCSTMPWNLSLMSMTRDLWPAFTLLYHPSPFPNDIATALDGSSTRRRNRHLPKKSCQLSDDATRLLADQKRISMKLRASQMLYSAGCVDLSPVLHVPRSLIHTTKRSSSSVLSVVRKNSMNAVS